MVGNIVSLQWLQDQLGSNHVRIIDCRFNLADPTMGFNDYLDGHLPESIYFDLNKDMSSEISEHGGRHPLPNVEEFTEKLAAAGISSSTTVVAYDDQGGAFASRLWWLLKFVGHEKVFVLDEGYSAWINKGLPVTKEIPFFEKSVYVPNLQEQMIATLADVQDSIKTKQSQLIDSREEIRYRGIEEPIDKIAGHIPGATNFFWKEVLNGAKWKNKVELETHFSTIGKDKEVIVYCGSGVTACPNVLALNELNYRNVKLYPGSWSDWITYPENMIATDK
ncbi:sulfurtransferase [Bacillus sp. PS06]|uniref:sulfurtransferase n=1 Tax=Bacillus sp. PS06 TaxID=2764176 RepID=UPI00177CA241|nr:sulfurtransferase [Bacillus sp. PS06]MBD8068154.1 sulfurtransferase [Bacillus sp. PS06]